MYDDVQAAVHALVLKISNRATDYRAAAVRQDDLPSLHTLAAASPATALEHLDPVDVPFDGTRVPGQLRKRVLLA